MRKPIKLLLFTIPLLIYASCDTTEDAFYVGETPQEMEVLNIDNSALTFGPEGDTIFIHVSSIAQWEVSFIKNASNQFSINQTAGKGNSILKVVAAQNKSTQSYDGELQIKPVNFNMEPIKISLKQLSSIFSIDSYPSTETTNEEGGTLRLTFYSSIDWNLEVQQGDIDYMTVTPGLSGSGNGGNVPIEFRFDWKPNYTQSERTIRVQLVPAITGLLDDSELPRPITFTQAAGTLPQNVSCKYDLDIVNANVTFDYSSNSPVKDCGVILYKVGANSVDSISTQHPSLVNNEYGKKGPFTYKLTELDENTTYRLQPYTYNEVGKVKGEMVEFTTEIKPINRVYQGITIVDGDNGGVTVETDLTSATISMTVNSDVTPLETRIVSAVMNFDGKTVNGKATDYGDGTWHYVFKTSDVAGELTSNKEYDYTIVFTGGELPREQGQVVNPNLTYKSKFKTQGRTPGSEDNDKPIINN